MNIWKKAAAVIGIGTAVALTGGVTSASAATLVASDRGCEFINTIGAFGVAPGGWANYWWIETEPTVNSSTSGLCRFTGRLDYKIDGDGSIHTYVFSGINNQRNPDQLGANGRAVQIQRQGIVACYGEECGNWVWS
jgi:hypothetical protein